jgi:hypothetical protein
MTELRRPYETTYWMFIKSKQQTRVVSASELAEALNKLYHIYF